VTSLGLRYDIIAPALTRERPRVASHLSKKTVMPVIKVISSGSPSPAPNQGDPAAAVMAAMLSKASEPLKVHEQRKRPRAEKTRRRYPNRLTVNQHVFPAKSIERFTDQSGNVLVHDLRRAKVFSAKPRNAIFCASRAWDERAEAGYMKRIEAEFQIIADTIVDGNNVTLSPESRGRHRQVVCALAYAVAIQRA
jgi:hypothetical protein